MALFLLIVLIAVLIIRWAMLHERLTSIERRIAELSSGGDDPATTEQIARLTQRVWRLEQKDATVQPTAPPPTPAAPPEFVAAPAERPYASPPPAFTQPPGEPSRSTLADRLRGLFGNEEWEALVGASLLNKIGALVLVIGIALFLAYSFTHMTPGGRTLTAFLASAVLLGFGIWLERKQAYQVFARGLLGAGWAGLYSTAYAMYAVPAARIIDNAFLGSLLLLAVAAGMIGHSLRYRVQAVTAIAYFTAFAALAATPTTPFAVAALIPLAATLLYLAWRFQWHGMAVFGLFATYATCISRGASDAPLVTTQTLFIAYWLLFEGFDLLRISRRDATRIAALIFPLNAAGFLGLSYLAWSTRAPGDRWMMSAIAAALYLAGALVRAWLRPPSSFAGGESAQSRYEQGSYEASLTLSAFLAGLAVVGRVTGVWVAVTLAVEAEILFLAGVHLNSRFLRALGWIGFFFSMERLFVVDVYRDQRSLLFGREIRNWTPPALFHAALFYLNRSLHRTAAFSWLATGLVALAVAAETQQHIVGVIWLLMAVALFEFGLWRERREFRLQAYCLACMGMFAVVAENAGEFAKFAPVLVWVSYFGAGALAWAAALRARSAPEAERAMLRHVAPPLGMLFTAAGIWIVTPESTVPVVWAGMALLLPLVGYKLEGYSAAALAFLHVWIVNFPSGRMMDAVSARLVTTAAVVAVLYAAEFLEARPSRARAYFSALATLLVAGLLWYEVSGSVLTVAWGVQGLLLLAAGFPARERPLRLAGLALLLFCISKLFLWDLRHLETLYRILAFVTLGAILLGVSWIYTRFRDSIRRGLFQ